MKGPFATYGEALAAADPGEIIVARDSAKFREAGWGVMADQEFTAGFNSFLNCWTHWETKKETA